MSTTARPSSPRYSQSTPCRRSPAYARARSGLRSVDPTAGGSPPGRNTRAVSGNRRNRSAFAAVCAWYAASTTNPRRARCSAGASSAPRLRLPKRRAASSQTAGVPGTPTDRPDDTTSANGSGVPSGFVNTVGVNVAGAVSRPSIVLTRRLRAS